MSKTVVISTNASQATDVTIADIGIVIPNSGGSETITNNVLLERVKYSNELRTLVTDDAFGAGSSTLIIGDGTVTLDQDDADAFLDHVEVPTQAAAVQRAVLTKDSVVKPFDTITAALAEATAGDSVIVGIGTYAESFTIPSGVTVKSQFGPDRTTISGSAATGTRVTLGTGSIIDGFSITMPTDATDAVTCATPLRSVVRDCIFNGAGASGRGIAMTGVGILQCDNTTYLSGTCDTLFSVSSGNLGMNLVLILGGTLTNIASISGGLCLVANFLTGISVSATDIFEVGAGSLILQNSRLRSGTNGIHITSDSHTVSANSTVIETGVTTALLVDPAITTADIEFIGQYDITTISAPDAFLSSNGLQQNVLDPAGDDGGFKIFGELSVGIPENGREAVFGEGDSYVRGMRVITTDSTATSTTEGGNLTDVSTTAQSETGSTFSFQGTAADHTILIGSSLENTVDKLKHWGIKVKQTTAAVEVTEKSFVFEIWNGSAWEVIHVLATHSSLFYRYGEALFIRSSLSEHIRYGITDSTTWSKKTIDGDELFWSRIRITDAVTVAPVFEQFKLSTSRSELNSNGVITHHGLARFRNTIQNSGNIFGEGGAISDASVAVGSGGDPTGWNHDFKNSELNGDADFINFHFALPEGIDTSQPLNVEVIYYLSNASTGTATFTLSFLPVEVQGVLVADSGGAIAPVARSLANTDEVTANTAQTSTISSVSTASTNKFETLTFTDFDVSDYYEGDIVLIRFSLDNDGAGAGADYVVAAVTVSGALWTQGAIL